MAKAEDPRYGAGYQKARTLAMARRGDGMCCFCGCEIATEAHHAVPGGYPDGGANLDDEKIEALSLILTPLCCGCHDLATNLRKERRKRLDVETGKPLTTAQLINPLTQYMIGLECSAEYDRIAERVARSNGNAASEQTRTLAESKRPVFGGRVGKTEARRTIAAPSRLR